MKIVVALFLLIAAMPAHAESFHAYKCTSAVDATDVFPVFLQGSAYSAALSMGSSRFFDLSPVPAGELSGWPVYEGGAYYRGGDDLWVLFRSEDALTGVLKPLQNVPNGVRYACVRTI